VSGFIITFRDYEKTFRDRGSGFVVEWEWLCINNILL